MKQNNRDTTNFLSLKPGKSTFSLKIVFVAEKKYKLNISFTTFLFNI